MKENDEKNFNFEDNQASNDAQARPSGAVDLYFQPVEDGDDDEEIDYKLNFTFNKAQKRDVKVALSNTFGFG